MLARVNDVRATIGHCANLPRVSVVTKKPDWTGLARAPFAPTRPLLARAREHLRPWFQRERDESDPAARDELAREAWESCATAGLIPIEWLTGERRWVRWIMEHVRRGRDRTLDITDARARQIIDHPPDVQACLTMASDPEGALAAEHLAERVRRSLTQWSSPTSPPIELVWRADKLEPETGSILLSYSEPPPGRLEYREFNLRGERAFSAALGDRSPQGWPLFIARMARESELYEVLVDLAYDSANAGGIVLGFEGRSNPYVHAAELFAMGYGVERSANRQYLCIVARPP
jgi:hypothetical protein